ncbi:C3a anaphylatoxin chemotactic receptor-like [Hypanus sabinus]|uniref:C3a anaphylatoxin chemotactic receptor-like n=1 Tax=Hypanus sabinus TaxID=79690 RepID=UPI0028C48F2E|nr:C3a anaphylatoxin chemotactic receptor-like [Hypanus sabinus]
MSIQEDMCNHTTAGNNTSNDPAVYKLTMISYVIAFLLGVPGNSAVIWVTGFKMERKIHTTCFLNLAVADIICCLTLPFWIVDVARQGTLNFDDLHLTLLFSAIVYNGSISVFMLTVISIVRCIAVTQPVWYYQHMKLRWVHTAFTVVCGLSILACMITLLYNKIKHYFGQMTGDILKVTWAVLIFVIPVVIMTICCALIGLKLHRDKFNKSRKPIRLILIMFAAFIASWLPYYCTSFASVFFNYCAQSWNYIAIAMASFNSALNPFLYVFTGRDFRQVFRRSLASSLRLAFLEEEFLSTCASTCNYGLTQCKFKEELKNEVKYLLMLSGLFYK